LNNQLRPLASFQAIWSPKISSTAWNGELAADLTTSCSTLQPGGRRNTCVVREPFHVTKTSAFTLIELLVALAVIAMLAALAIPSLTNSLSKARMHGAASANGRLVRTPHLDLTNDRPVAPAEEFDVNVYTDEERPHAGEQSEPVQLVGLQNVFPVEVWLVGSEDFTVIGEALKELTIKRSEKRSPNVTFRVRVNDNNPRPHAGVLTACFAYRGRPTGKVKRAVDVYGRASGQRESHTLTTQKPEATLHFDRGLKEPDLTVEVLDPEQTSQHFKVKVRTPWLPDYRDGKVEDWFLPSTTPEIVAGLMSGFLEATDAEQRISLLRGVGKDLFDKTPSHFKRAFWALVDSKDSKLQTIYIMSQESYFPWELVMPHRQRPGSKEEVRASLGVSFAMGRWIPLKEEEKDYFSPPQTIPWRDCLVVAPSYGNDQTLPSTAAEADFIHKNLQGNVMEHPNWHELNNLLLTGSVDMLHFACHGKSRGITANQVLYLESGEVLNPSQVNGAAGFEKFGARKPFVFLNACEAGRESPSLNGPNGFATKFIGVGAVGVVAPLWSVKDTVAKDVAIEFYTKLTSEPSRSFASILQGIRAKAYDGSTNGEDTYAAYCFYGDPFAKWGP